MAQRVYVMTTTYQHGLGESVDTDTEVFSDRDKAVDAMEKKGFETLESYKQIGIDDEDIQVSKSDFFFNITDQGGETWDKIEISEQEVK